MIPCHACQFYGILLLISEEKETLLQSSEVRLYFSLCSTRSKKVFFRFFAILNTVSSDHLKILARKGNPWEQVINVSYGIPFGPRAVSFSMGVSSL